MSTAKNVQRVAFLPYLLYVGYEALYPQKAIAILVSLVNAAFVFVSAVSQR